MYSEEKIFKKTDYKNPNYKAPETTSALLLYFLKLDIMIKLTTRYIEFTTRYIEFIPRSLGAKFKKAASFFSSLAPKSGKGLICAYDWKISLER